MGYYLAIKRNEILPFARALVDPQGVMLNEISHPETDRYYTISQVWKNLKKNINE